MGDMVSLGGHNGSTGRDIMGTDVTGWHKYGPGVTWWHIMMTLGDILVVLVVHT